MSDRLAVGDLVEAVPPTVLHCGTGIYKQAVVASIDPLIIISNDGTMLWRKTIMEGNLKKIGTASYASLMNVLLRVVWEANLKSW